MTRKERQEKLIAAQRQADEQLAKLAASQRQADEQLCELIRTTREQVAGQETGTWVIPYSRINRDRG